jgi:hypothetical protein
MPVTAPVVILINVKDEARCFRLILLATVCNHRDKDCKGRMIMQFRKIKNVRRGWLTEQMFVEVPHPKGWTDHIGVPKGCPDEPIAVAETKSHAVVLRVDNNVALVEARGSRLWLHSRGLWSEQRSYRYFCWAGPGPCPDVCLYCGFNNGQNGESRYGWDCGRCGGN